MAFKRSAVRSRVSPPHFSNLYGGIAQLGEHLLCKQGVSGSIPLTSTIFFQFIRGYSSVGRAPALQAGGQRFDPAYLHHIFQKVFMYCCIKAFFVL